MLVSKLYKYELRKVTKQLFVNRLVKLWNMLPDEVESVSSVSSFKRQDGLWCDLDLYCNYKADMQHRNSQCNNSRLLVNFLL